MKKIFLSMTFLAALFGCQMSEMDTAFEEVSNMKVVTLSADMPSVDTKAALSSRNGHFSWQENDQIAVLASDGKFYTLTLTEGADTHLAKFAGEVPQDVTLSNVAAYPAFSIVETTEKNAYDATSGKLTYTLPSEYDFIAGNTNVPMVATVTDVEGELTASFKQIGAVVRFPVNALPKEAKVIFTVKGIEIPGEYEVSPADGEPTTLVAKTAEETSTTVVVNYSSEKAGLSADFNMPVPTGYYKECSFEVFDAEDKSMVKTEYNLDREINRATLLMMNAVDAGPMTISEVWPYFTDARVFFSKFSGVSKYAIYVDEEKNPRVVRGEEVEGGMVAVISGLENGSTHTIKVTKVVDGLADWTTMSEPVTFTTGRVMQMTYNTGTKFVCAGWDDMALGVEHAPQYVNGRWTLAWDTSMGSEQWNRRGYQVQLYAADKTTLLYDEIPFSGMHDYGGAFTTSSQFGKVGGKSSLLPTSLTFGWLEPGNKYYFRVKTLDEPVEFEGPEDGYFKPSGSKITLSSERGGSAWSDFVELSTDDVHVAGTDEIFYEGFDDMMFNSDALNICPALIPQVLTEATPDQDKNGVNGYVNRASADLYYEWLKKDPSQRKWAEQSFYRRLTAYQQGLTDDDFKDENTGRVLNKYAGSLQGWSIYSTKSAADIYPGFGIVRLGNSPSKSDVAEIRTAPITSTNLPEGRMIPSKITVKVAPISGKSGDVISKVKLNLYRHDGISYTLSETYIEDFKYEDFKEANPTKVKAEWTENYTVNGSDYMNRSTWFEVSTTFYIKSGDILGIEHGGSNLGLLAVGELKIEVDKDATADYPENRFYGTAPDNTDYDVWGMNGKLPITFWMGPPVLDQFNADATSDQELANIKATYFDPIVQGGYNLIEVCNPYPASMKVLLQWCQEAGVKLLDKSDSVVPGGYTDPQVNIGRVLQYANNDSYAGLFVGEDEPGYDEFPLITNMNAAFKAALPNKARNVNLFPSYASSKQLNAGNNDVTSFVTSVANFEQYVEAFLNQVDVSDRMFNLMFDHYCLEKSDKNGNAVRARVKSKQLRDLDVVRTYTLAKRIPFMQITHGRPQWDPGYSATIVNTDPAWTTDVSATALPPKPDEHVYDEQRWLVWSQLALGSKGVSYFCYWTPYSFKGGSFSFHYDGTKTRMYDIIKNINTEIQPIGEILMSCHADGAIVTNPTGQFTLFQNSGKGLTNYGPVLSAGKTMREDILVGCFRDAATGEYKVLATHKMPATDDKYASQATGVKLKIDRGMVTKVKLHTVTLGADKKSAATTVVTEQSVLNGELILSIPDGTAVLVEFPETANVSYN